MISVIIPCFNQKPELLYAAIFSVLFQTYKGELEVIVVDDGSKIPVTFMSDPRVKINRLGTNCGIASALNAGFLKAKGEYVCWLSSDDIFYPEKLQIQYDIMKQHGCDASCHGYDIMFLQNNIFNRSDSHYLPPHNKANSKSLYDGLKKECFINGSTVMMKKSIYQSIGYFDSTYPYCQDWEYWLRIAKNNIYVYPIEQSLGARREHATNFSNPLYKDQKRLASKGEEVARLSKIYKFNE